MATEKRLIDANGKFTLNAGDITGHIMCVENGYATVFDRWAKVICKFDLLDAPTVDAVEVVHSHWLKEGPYKSAGGEYKKALICPECNSWFVSDGNIPWKLHNYCPNCGAKMDGDGNET